MHTRLRHLALAVFLLAALASATAASSVLDYVFTRSWGGFGTDEGEFHRPYDLVRGLDGKWMNETGTDTTTIKLEPGRGYWLQIRGSGRQASIWTPPNPNPGAGDN